jgi:hypothetical protein
MINPVNRLLARCVLLATLSSQAAYAEYDNVVTVTSPENRVVLLELYTSEGCSSCPPAERWLSSLKDSGISSQQIIPLAFHVTYWDYIGWRDQFASERHDQRQRQIARYNAQSTIYTPQFVLGGSDYRTYSRFTSDVRKIVSQASVVDLELSANLTGVSKIDIKLSADISRSGINDVALYVVVYENDLSVDVEDGENEGELLHHDYVVRNFYGPSVQRAADVKKTLKLTTDIGESWKQEDLYLVAFAQNPQTGEVLQAVQLDLQKKY